MAAQADLLREFVMRQFIPTSFLRLVTQAGLLCIGILSLATVAQAEQKFYKWVDRSGATHYTQAPPPAGEVRRVTTRATKANATRASSVRTVTVSNPVITNPVPMAVAPTPANSTANGANQSAPGQSNVVNQQSGQASNQGRTDLPVSTTGSGQTNVPVRAPATPAVLPAAPGL